MTESNLENIRDAEGKIMDKAKADNKARRSMSLDVSLALPNPTAFLKKGPSRQKEASFMPKITSS